MLVDLEADQDASKIGTMIAIMKQADIPASAQLHQKIEKKQHTKPSNSPSSHSHTGKCAFHDH